MIYLQLAWEFFKIGLFAVGGGMAALPFLRHLAERTGWFTVSLLTDMVAISESTPGPIGINMATYVGYQVGGWPGAVIASVAVALPSLLLILLLAQSLARFRTHPLVESAFYGLRPAVTGLIAAAGVSVMQSTFLHWDGFLQERTLSALADGKQLLFFLVISLCIFRWKKHPIFYIALSAAAGIVLQF